MKDIDLVINYVQKLTMDYSPYQEDTVIIGKKREGKSERIKRIIESKLTNIPYWIWDFSNRFEGYGHLVHEVDDLQYGQYVLQAYDKSTDNFRRFCEKAFQGAQSGEFSNLGFIVDELHQHVSKQSMLQELYDIVMSGRNFGLFGIYASTRPQAIPNWILENVTHIFAYKLELSGTILWMRDFIGLEAWLLLNRDTRKFLYSEKYPELPNHSVIYRNKNEPKPQVMMVNG